MHAGNDGLAGRRDTAPRPRAGPAFSRVAHPIRPLLKPGARFPPNDEQQKAIDALKKLVVETHVLHVPDEEAAIRAAYAWQNGEPPEGKPYEMGADTSKIAIGGVLGQANEDGILMVLMYFSAPLSVGQSMWHPFEQELYGLLHTKRAAVKSFGRIPYVYWLQVLRSLSA